MGGDPFWRAIEAGGLNVPEGVAAFHRGLGVRRYAGQCEITRGRGVLVRLGLGLAGFPPAGSGVPVRLMLDVRDDGAVWVRDFGGHVTRSRLSWDVRRGRVMERFGPFRVAMVPELEGDVLHMRIAGLSVLGVPVPRWLVPASETREFVDEAGRFRFEVAARVPVLGLLIRYAGWVEAE